MRLPWRTRRAEVRQGSAKRPAAVFTIVQNEPAFLPVWSRYYSRHFAAEDIFILDHDSTDPTTLRVGAGFNRVPVHRQESFDHNWLRDVVAKFQAFLLASYEVVLFAEVDEIVAPRPERFPRGLAEFIERFVAQDAPLSRCTGYEIVHDGRGGEAPLDWSAPILAQRRQCRRSLTCSKPLLSRRALEWIPGFHRLTGRSPRLPPPDPELLLLHLHRVDFESCFEKTLETAARKWSRVDIENGSADHNRITDPVEFERWFYTEFFDDLYVMEPIPSSWKDIV